jgi:hypothetical protein
VQIAARWRICTGRASSQRNKEPRRQVSPNRLFLLKQVAFRKYASRTAQLVKATSLHFAKQHVRRTF